MSPGLSTVLKRRTGTKSPRRRNRVEAVIARCLYRWPRATSMPLGNPAAAKAPLDTGIPPFNAMTSVFIATPAATSPKPLRCPLLARAFAAHHATTSKQASTARSVWSAPEVEPRHASGPTAVTRSHQDRSGPAGPRRGEVAVVQPPIPPMSTASAMTANSSLPLFGGAYRDRVVWVYRRFTQRSISPETLRKARTSCTSRAANCSGLSAVGRGARSSERGPSMRNVLHSRLFHVGIVVAGLAAAWIVGGAPVWGGY